jgi:hypothetical protein
MIKTSKRFFQLLCWASLSVTLLVVGCSDEKEPATPVNVTSSSSSSSISSSQVRSVDSPTDPTPEAEDNQKEQFQHDFAAQCAERELNNATNQSTDADKINKSCECIAAYIAKDLTDEEAKKFLSEHDHPQSLRIKFEAAAYECLQEKVKPVEPKLSTGAQ